MCALAAMALASSAGAKGAGKRKAKKPKVHAVATSTPEVTPTPAPTQPPTPAPTPTPPPTPTPTPPPTPPLTPTRPPTPPPSDDIKEVILDDATLPTAPSAAPPPPPPSPDRYDLSGWARQTAEAPFRPTEAGLAAGTALPYDRGIARTQALVRARYRHGDSFEVTASGVFDYDVFVRGKGVESWTGHDPVKARQELNPRLHELYFGLYSSKLDFRVGQQRVAWGRADAFGPNDVLNARDLRDPIWSETETRHVPTPMVRADWDLGFATLEGIFQPLFVPDTYDVYGSNWAAIQPDSPAPYRGFLRLLTSPVDPTEQGQVNRLLQQTSLPSAGPDSFGAGAKLAWTMAGTDVDAYYHYGFDTSPFIALNPGFAAALATTDFSTANLESLAPVLQSLDAGVAPFRVTYVRRHHVGLDAARAVGPFVLRVDAAYDTQRVFYRSDLTSVASPAFQGVASIEYQTGDVEQLYLLEGMYTRVVDDPQAPLLFYQRDTYALAAAMRFPIAGPLRAELRALAGEPRSIVVQPQLHLKFGAWRVSAGLAWLDGDPGTFGAYFRRDTSAFGAIKYSF